MNKALFSVASIKATVVAAIATAALFLLPSAVSAVTVNMTAQQWEFIPSTITVTEGDSVTMNIESVDVDHGISLSAFGVSDTLSAGSTTTISFTADTAGTYSFFCNVFCGSGHGSMKGTLIVEAAAEEVVEEEEVTEEPVEETTEETKEESTKEVEPTDTTAPFISGVSVSSVASTTAMVSWTSDEAGFGQVEYGTASGNYIAATPLEESASKSHSAFLSGLSAGTKYYFRAKTKDDAGNTGFSTEMSFTTEAVAESTTTSEEDSAEESSEAVVSTEETATDTSTETEDDTSVIAEPTEDEDGEEADESTEEGEKTEEEEVVEELEADDDVAIEAATEVNDDDSNGGTLAVVVFIVLLGAVILAGASFLLFRQIQD